MPRFAFVLIACVLCSHGRFSSAQETPASAALFDALVGSFGLAPSQSIGPQKPEPAVQQPQAATVPVARTAPVVREPATTASQSEEPITQAAPAPLAGYMSVEGEDVPGYVNRPQATIVRVTATWCGPCKKSHGPLYEYGSAGGLALSVDADKNPGFVQQYQVTGMPTYLLFRNGKLVKREAGAKFTLDALKLFADWNERTSVASK